MKVAELAERLTALEAEVRQLRTQVSGSKRVETVQEFLATTGTFRDDPGFEEMVELGRKYRRSLDKKPRRKAVKKS